MDPVEQCVVKMHCCSLRDACSGQFGGVDIEDGIDQSVIDGLSAMDHETRGPVTGFARSVYGWGQVITRGAWWKSPDNESIVDDRSVLWTGVDPRCDGITVAY